MPGASYALNSKHLGYFFLIMFMVMFMIVILLYASLTGNVSLIYNSFLLLGIMGLIVIVFTWWRKSEFSHNRIPDYSLKNK